MASKGSEDFEEEEDVAAAAFKLGMSILAAPPPEDTGVNEGRLRNGQRSMVQVDGVLKERVENQERARKSWEKNWTAVAQCEKMFREEMKKIGVDPRPPALRPCPPFVASSAVLSSPAVPTLTSGLIGWRSTNPELTLETFGPFYKSPLHTIEPPPQKDQLLPNKQFFIFLG